jgi:hypothetical protein
MTAAAGAISQDEAASWRDAVARAAAQRRYFFSVSQFLVRGEVASARAMSRVHL